MSCARAEISSTPQGLCCPGAPCACGCVCGGVWAPGGRAGYSQGTVQPSQRTSGHALLRSWGHDHRAVNGGREEFSEYAGSHLIHLREVTHPCVIYRLLFTLWVDRGEERVLRCRCLCIFCGKFTNILVNLGKDISFWRKCKRIGFMFEHIRSSLKEM